MCRNRGAGKSDSRGSRKKSRATSSVREKIRAAAAISGCSSKESIRTWSRIRITPQFSQARFPSRRCILTPRTRDRSITFPIGPTDRRRVSPLTRRDCRRSDQRNIVFLHGVVERRHIFGKDLVPLREPRFELAVEIGEDAEFAFGGLGVGAVHGVLQIAELAVQLGGVVELVFAGF